MIAWRPTTNVEPAQTHLIRRMVDRSSQTCLRFLTARWRLDQSHEPTKLAAVKSDYFPGLDVLRGFAAISVVVYHVIELLDWKAFPYDNAVALWFRVGWMGVDLFFVISGFVISLSALRLLDRSPRNYARSFCVRRFARIIPLHYLTCLIFIVFVTPAWLLNRKLWVHALTHATFTHNLSPLTYGSINGPNWSLGVEMQFYLLILLIAPWMRRTRPLVLLATCIAVAWIWRTGAFHLFRSQTVRGVNLTWFSTYQLPGMLDVFGFGMAWAMLIHADHHGRLRQKLNMTRWLWPFIAALLTFVAMKAFWRDSSYWDNWRCVILWRTLLAAACLSAVVSACALNDPWFLRLTRPLRYLGTISFGIYLWHIPVITVLKPQLIHNPARACYMTLGLTLLLATLSWHFFEKPLMERFGEKKKPFGNEEALSVSICRDKITSDASKAIK